MDISNNPGKQRPLSAVLEGLSERFFVGREKECRLLAEYLAGKAGGYPIINIYGPGGVGKSTLLDAFHRLAEPFNTLYIYLDFLDLPKSPHSLVKELAALLGLSGSNPPLLEDCLRFLHEETTHRPVILALDSYEETGSLDKWLRGTFIPRLPDKCLIIIAGRFPLINLWRESPAWRQIIKPLPLAPFDVDLTRQYLALHGLTDDRAVRAAWESTRGHPLTLSLVTALVEQDGPEVLTVAPSKPEVIIELTKRWLREVPDNRLRELLEAAATVRRFDQELLAHMTGTTVTPAEMDQLRGLSFVRSGHAGWMLHSMVRNALLQEFSWRAPARLADMRQKALTYYARLLTAPRCPLDWGLFLEEFFFLLGDALIGATFFHSEGEESSTWLYVVPAVSQDLPKLQMYFQKCRHRAETEGPAAFEMFDPQTGTRFTYPYLWVDFVRAPFDFTALMDLAPGVVRMARDALGRLRGVSVVIPVNAATLPYLESQPVTRNYFGGLSPAEKAEYTVPPNKTAAWFIRHLHTCDLNDATARSALFRDIFQLAFRNGRLLTSSPAPFFQDLLRRCGFTEVPGATHYDFGTDCPSPTYCLDVRGHKLTHLLMSLIHGRVAPKETEANALVSTLAQRLSTWANLKNAPFQLEDLPPGEVLLHSLTTREKEVALAVLDGLSNLEIALRLGIKPLTAKKHLTRIFEKMNVNSRTQLIRKLLSDTTSIVVDRQANH